MNAIQKICCPCEYLAKIVGTTVLVGLGLIAAVAMTVIAIVALPFLALAYIAYSLKIAYHKGKTRDKQGIALCEHISPETGLPVYRSGKEVYEPHEDSRLRHEKKRLETLEERKRLTKMIKNAFVCAIPIGGPVYFVATYGKRSPPPKEPDSLEMQAKRDGATVNLFSSGEASPSSKETPKKTKKKKKLLQYQTARTALNIHLGRAAGEQGEGFQKQFFLD